MDWKALADIAREVSPFLSFFLIWLWFEIKGLKIKVNDQTAMIELVEKLDKRLVVLETILDEMRRK